MEHHNQQVRKVFRCWPLKKVKPREESFKPSLPLTSLAYLWAWGPSREENFGLSW